MPSKYHEEKPLSMIETKFQNSQDKSQFHIEIQHIEVVKSNKKGEAQRCEILRIVLLLLLVLGETQTTTNC